MSSSTFLSLGEKLKQVRRAKGLSQDNVAYAVNNHTSIISRIENGHIDPPPPELLDAIRKFLDIQSAPLLPDEMKIYSSRIQRWSTLLDSNRIDDAKAMQPELAHILSLPFEHDMILKYKMQETRLYFKQDNFTAAEENIRQAEPMLPYASIEALIMYYSNKGFLSLSKFDYKDSFSNYHKALDFFGDKPPSTNILGILAHLCILTGKYHHGIRYIQHARVLYEGDRANPMGYYMNEFLALCYLGIGETKKAEALFDISYKQAMLTGDVINQGVTLLNMADISRRRGDYEKSHEQLSKALELYDINISEVILYDKTMYVQIVFTKAILEVKMNMDNTDTIAKGRALAEGNETHTIMLDAAYHLSNLGNADSEKYLEDIAIPHLMQCETQEKNLRLLICKELETHYKRKKSKTKAAYMAAIIRDIYEEMFLSKEE